MSEPTSSSIPWPSSSNNNDTPAAKIKRTSYLAERRLNTWHMAALSISMLGVQMSWAVELAYGNPYLLGLGVSDQATSLVWLAGPLSGLIAQPLIGALSDSSASRYRRRAWVIASTAVLIVSGTVLAYSKSLAALLVYVWEGNCEDDTRITNVAIPIAVLCFYLFDFAINGVQASLRNLLLDITPQHQLNTANAWQARMLHAGSIMGNGLGLWDLSELPIIRLLGGDQFRKFCMLAMIILLLTVTITVVTQDEKQGSPVFGRQRSKISDAISNIGHAMLQLPRPIRRVCYVQMFSWIGWFPFLFYATSYMGQIMAMERGQDPDTDDVARTGEIALFLYSLVAVASGTLIPWLSSRDQRLLSQEETVEDEITKIREMVRGWKAEATRDQKPLKLPTMPFMLRNIWTASLLLFSGLMFSTFFVRTVTMATVIIALTGICWAITCWVPFAILMEYLKEVDSGAVTQRATRNNNPALHRVTHSRAISTPLLRGERLASGERVPLIRRLSLLDDGELPPADDLSKSKKPLAGGTVLGIHNLAIVFPQFFVSIAASLIFKIANRTAEPGKIFLGKTGVGWVMRFGGLSALIAAIISRMVPPTRTEKEMRRRLAEMARVDDSTAP